MTIDPSDDQYYKELLLQSPIAAYTCDAQGVLTFYNHAAAALWGRHPEIGKDRWCGSWKIFHPDGRPMALDECPMARVLQGTELQQEEIVIERPDHSLRSLLVFPRPIFNAAGQRSGAHNTLVDISSHKKDEERSTIWSAIVASSGDAIISKTLEGIITTWNRGAEKIFGYTENEVIGKKIDILIPPDLLAEEKMIISSIREGIRIDHYQTTRLTKTGQLIPISLTVSPVKDKQGRIVGASKIARDISVQHRQEEQLRQTAQSLELVSAIGKIISEKLDVNDILQKVTDATTKVTGAAFGAFFYNTQNEAGEALMLYSLCGAPREAFEHLGMPRNTAIFSPTFNGEAILRSDDIRKDPRYGLNSPNRGMPQGHLPVVSYMAVPVVSTSGKVIGGLFFGHPKPGVFRQEHEDVVSSIASQAAVALDNSRLFEEVKTLNAKKDEFIALASHELKTPLTTIKSCLQILQKTDDEKVRKLFVEKSINQADKLNLLVSDLFDISKVEAGKLQMTVERFDLLVLAQDLIETFRHSRESHDIALSCAVQEVWVAADKQRIEQVLTNLLNNAIKYSPGAKRVYLQLQQSDTGITVTVKDEGIGIAPDEQKKIFTRFYRAGSNPNISGLGLGLYLSREIIERHRGHIGVQSEPGKGATFYFNLPLRHETR